MPVALVVGDVLALLIFVIIGRLSHGFTSDWLDQCGKVSPRPSWIGWFVVAFVVGAYRAS
ncbi:MAG: DUF3054 family protein [Caldilineaceae bacterium]